MDRDETKRLLGALRTAYPQFYARKSTQELRMVVDLWHAALAEFDYGQICAALPGLLRKSVYAPTIAEVAAAVQEHAPNELTALAARDAQRRRQCPQWTQRPAERLRKAGAGGAEKRPDEKCGA